MKTIADGEDAKGQGEGEGARMVSYTYQALQSVIRQEQALALLRRVCGDDRRACELHQQCKDRAAKAALETVESFDSAFQRELDTAVRELCK